MATESLDLLRAQKAFDITKDIKPKEREAYKSSVQKMPMLIYNNGLAAALMFLKTDLVYDAAFEWIKFYQDKYQVFPTGKFNDKGKLVEDIINLDSELYRLATLEMLAFFSWLKRCVGGEWAKAK